MKVRDPPSPAPLVQQPRRLNFVAVTPSVPEERPDNLPVFDPPQFRSRGNTRVSSLVASDVQNSLQETVRSLEEASRRNDQLIQNCIKEAEKHQAEIEELENRTALHIEYAQEKQIEIQHLGKSQQSRHTYTYRNTHTDRNTYTYRNTHTHTYRQIHTHTHTHTEQKTHTVTHGRAHKHRHTH